jgi:outer membrane receptor protein involved in Fe transport
MRSMKNVTALLLVLGLSLAGTSALAQQPGGGRPAGGRTGSFDPNNLPKVGQISGKVIDAASGQSIPYATIALYNQPVQFAQRPGGGQPPRDSLQQRQAEQVRQFFSNRDTTVIVTGASTDDSGAFLVTEVPYGVFRARISFLGFETITLSDLRITPNNTQLNLGEVRLQPSAEMLDEVEVAAEREVVEFAIDRKIFNVDKNVLNASGSAEDVMRTIPTVEVDVEGNVSLRGSQNVTILIDGKPSNLAEILDQLPAESIERVELITNPSARFDAEGTAGIINIVLKKQKLIGYHGQLSAGAANGDKYNASANLNYRRDKLNFFTNYNYRQFAFVQGSSNFRTNLLADTTFYFDQVSDATRRFGGHNVRLGLDYFLDELTSLTLSGSYNTRGSDGSSGILYNYLDENQALVYNNNRDTDSDGSGDNLDAALNFLRKYKTPGRELSADINYSQGLDENFNYFTQTAFLPGFPDLEQRNLSDNTRDQWSFRVDYVHPFLQKGRFEAGVRSTLRGRDTDYFAEQLNALTGGWENDPNLSNRFLYDEDIHAAYMTGAYTYRKLGVQVGLRAEQTYARGNQVTTGQTFEKSYIDFFPSLALRQELKGNQTLNLNYSRRLNRPRDFVLNPFTDYTDPLNIRTGNPDLDPEMTDAIEAGYTRFWSKYFVTANTFYRRTNNVIGSIINVNDQGVAATTYENLNRTNNFGVELIGNVRPVQGANVNVSFNFYRNEVSGVNAQGERVDDSGNSWSARLFANMMLPGQVSFQSFFNYSAPRVGGFGGGGFFFGGGGGGGTRGGSGGGGGGGGGGFFGASSVNARSTSEANYSLDMGFRKTIWKDKTDLSLRISDVLNSRDNNATTEGLGFIQVTESRFDRRTIWLSVSHRFGTLKTQQDRRRENGNATEIREEDFVF